MKKLLIAVVALGLLCSAQALAATAKIGHRGARALSDENTLESLKLAAELGVDMIEFDVHRTKDGVFVLMHDDTVDRTTDGSGWVNGMTLDEFKKLKTGRGYTPPTLAEVLDWLKTNSLKFIIDFKITDEGQAKALIAQVEESGLLARSIFESPDPKVAGMIEKLRPDIVTSIYPVNMLGMRYYMIKYDIDIASYQYAFANPIELALLPKGKQAMVWTVNDPKVIKKFEKRGVYGIMTDDPNNFKQ